MTTTTIDDADARESEGVGSTIRVSGFDAGAHESRLEFSTTIRGDVVTCWVEDGHLWGDAALMDRLSRFVITCEPLGPIDVVHLLRDAVGSKVAVRFNGDLP